MLTELLEKLGIKNPEQLKPSELATYRAWSVIRFKALAHDRGPEEDSR
jgi:hypothetical protein